MEPAKAKAKAGRPAKAKAKAKAGREREGGALGGLERAAKTYIYRAPYVNYVERLTPEKNPRTAPSKTQKNPAEGGGERVATEGETRRPCLLKPLD